MKKRSSSTAAEVVTFLKANSVKVSAEKHSKNKDSNSQFRVQEVIAFLKASTEDFSLDDNKTNRRVSSGQKRKLGKNKLRKAS